MKDDFIYVPIIKWKQGEQEALKELDDNIKDKIMPLIELTTDIKLENLEETLKLWENRYFYFDIIPEFYEEYGGKIYFDLLEKCNANHVIPVIFPSDDINIIKKIYNYSKNGIAIRITPNDLDNLDENFLKLKDHFNYSDIDIIIDLKEVNESNLSEKKIVVKALLPNIPEIDTFRNVILASSAFPQSLSGFEKYEITQIKRYDYQLWKSLLSLEDKYNIKLIYSDYAISSPGFVEFKPYMVLSYNLRYSTYDSFVIIKGDPISKGGLDPGNVISSCEKIIRHEEFLGEDYSWGNKYICTRCEKDTKNFGNLGTWRKVGTNHHITLVVNQLSTLP